MAGVLPVGAASDAGVQGDAEALNSCLKLIELEVPVLLECCLVRTISHLPVGSHEV